MTNLMMTGASRKRLLEDGALDYLLLAISPGYSENGLVHYEALNTIIVFVCEDKKQAEHICNSDTGLADLVQVCT